MHLVKKLLAVSVFLCASAQAQNILEFPQPENNPEEFYAVTEIPAGGMIKYETDAKTGFIVADRFQSMPVAYPANYGSLTQSLAGDGDPLDVIFYTRAPLAPGTLIKLRAIGVLKMIDGGEKDDKIVAVPASKIDPTYDDIKELSSFFFIFFVSFAIFIKNFYILFYFIDHMSFYVFYARFFYISHNFIF